MVSEQTKQKKKHFKREDQFLHRFLAAKGTLEKVEEVENG